MTGAGYPTPTLSMHLVRILERIRREELPEPVIDKARTCCLDFLAACLSASGSKSADIGLEAAMRMGRGRSTLIGRGEKGTLLSAALYNGLIAHAEELDDSHRYVSGLHPGAVVIPAALAVAEEQGLSGSAFIRAVVCGYEAAARICRCIEQGHRSRGFHSTGTVGPFGACAAAGAALNLDAEQMVQAIGIAGSMGAGLFAFLEDGATVKHLHPGRAALDGLLAALMARAGMTGPRAVLEAAEGFFHAYADSYNAAPLHAPLEGAYEIGNAYHKLHSACGHAFPAIDAALHLRREFEDPERQIASIDVRTYRAAAVLENRRPRSLQEARFSIPFLVALIMWKGSADRKTLLSADLSDPVLLDLADRVALREDPEIQSAFPRLRACIMRIRRPDGRELTCRIDSPRGMPDNPVSFREIEDKFMAESAGTLDDRRAGRVLDAVRGLDKLPSIRGLTGLLSG
ncbi:MAG: MmgE/PrpD family protein [Thermodesulfobacteriota bacterium]